MIDLARVFIGKHVDCVALIATLQSVTGDTNRMLALRLFCASSLDMPFFGVVASWLAQLTVNGRLAFITLCAK